MKVPNKEGHCTFCNEELQPGYRFARCEKCRRICAKYVADSRKRKKMRELAEQEKKNAEEKLA